jgi:energy-coupling factor transport system ATP-binding protein
LIRFEQVSFSYTPTRHSPPAVDSLSLQMQAGERLAVLGANGSGKSTMVRLANALLLPVSGVVSVEGMDTTDPKSADAIRKRVSVVFQNPDNQIVATSVEDDVAFGPENLGLPRPEIRRRVDAALEAVGLVGLERREPHLLSGGQKQRLAIAGALAMGSQYLILDEPTSMLDPTGRAEVLDVLAQVAESGRAVVHVTHDLSEAMRAHRALVMHQGAVVFDGPPTALLVRPDLLIGWGLELPPIVRLADELRLRGAEIPLEATTPAEIAAAL